MKIYEEFPIYENDAFLLRPVEKGDCADLLEVYSDKMALPFFNSDNCDGDNFYYSTEERMADALLFWQSAYENRWFARWSIVDKSVSRAIGTIELCSRVSDDAFNGAAILRIDVKSDYEKEGPLFNIGSLIVPSVFALFDCKTVITKAPAYAVERISAVQRLGFQKSGHFLIGKTGYAYDGYWLMDVRTTVSGRL
ncbi:MAG: N-acetyltransferase [Blautia sp.]|nr:N-acetyltransferase [Blautia sp.]MCM1200292.1 hypothetical protein [Bacteroides fragilis]